MIHPFSRSEAKIDSVLLPLPCEDSVNRYITAKAMTSVLDMTLSDRHYLSHNSDAMTASNYSRSIKTRVGTTIATNVCAMPSQFNRHSDLPASSEKQQKTHSFATPLLESLLQTVSTQNVFPLLEEIVVSSSDCHASSGTATVRSDSRNDDARYVFQYIAPYVIEK